jgi:hypothetical protein
MASLAWSKHAVDLRQGAVVEIGCHLLEFGKTLINIVDGAFQGLGSGHILDLARGFPNVRQGLFQGKMIEAIQHPFGRCRDFFHRVGNRGQHRVEITRADILGFSFRLNAHAHVALAGQQVPRPLLCPQAFFWTSFSMTLYSGMANSPESSIRSGSMAMSTGMRKVNVS